MAMVNQISSLALNPNAKDSRWLTLEVCREFQRNKCTRPDTECKFAHPPPHVEIQNGRVVACFDSIKGKCQRKDPPCKYLHPPQHLREQLLANGRNNLILKNLQFQAVQQQLLPGLIPVAAAGKPVAYPTAVMPGQIPYVAAASPQSRPTHVNHPAFVTFASSTSAPARTPHYLSSAVPSSMVAAQFSSPYGLPTMAVPGGADGTMVTQQIPGVISTPITKPSPRPDRLEPQVVEVLTGKKRRHDPTEELVMPMGLVPPYKRVAVDGTLGKSGIPVYQPAIPATSPYHPATLMQLQQQPYIPVTYSGDVMSSAYTNYLPQVTGHPPAVPRF